MEGGRICRWRSTMLFYSLGANQKEHRNMVTLIDISEWLITFTMIAPDNIKLDIFENKMFCFKIG